jgi:hypothetical protein
VIPYGRPVERVTLMAFDQLREQLEILRATEKIYTVENLTPLKVTKAKTLQFILSCKSHEVESIKLQKSNCRAFQTTC